MRNHGRKADGQAPSEPRLTSGTRRHGGQAAAQGVIGSHMLVSCGTRLFSGGGIDPDTTQHNGTAADGHSRRR
jgi:hypothetical protein